MWFKSNSEVKRVVTQRNLRRIMDEFKYRLRVAESDLPDITVIFILHLFHSSVKIVNKMNFRKTKHFFFRFSPFFACALIVLQCLECLNFCMQLVMRNGIFQSFIEKAHLSYVKGWNKVDEEQMYHLNQFINEDVPR